MLLRTDLAIESNDFKNKKLKAIVQVVKHCKDIEIVRIEIKNKEQSKLLKRPIGVYVTITSTFILVPEKLVDFQMALKQELLPFVANKNSVLVVGLGNKKICCDSVGPKVAEKVVATRHIKNQIKETLQLLSVPAVSVVAPGVLGQTGIETLEIVKSLVNTIKPDLVVVIDSLAAASVKRLGTTIQLTNTGIAPGSGVGNRRKELSKDVLNVPVLAIGIPTVVDLKSFSHGLVAELKQVEHAMMITPKNVDEIVDSAQSLIAGAINGAIFPMLSEQELAALSC